jgi:hypothetical protein
MGIARYISQKMKEFGNGGIIFFFIYVKNDFELLIYVVFMFVYI